MSIQHTIVLVKVDVTYDDSRRTERQAQDHFIEAVTVDPDSGLDIFGAEIVAGLVDADCVPVQALVRKALDFLNPKV